VNKALMIYCAGPYTSGQTSSLSTLENIARGTQFAFEVWRALDYAVAVYNPWADAAFVALAAQNDEKVPTHCYLQASLTVLARCDGVVFMAGWQNSKGCREEMILANDLGIPVFDCGESDEWGDLRAWARGLGGRAS
jgi:hypothetical protein